MKTLTELEQLRRQIVERLAHVANEDGGHPTAIDELTLFRISEPTEPSAWLYEPSLSVIVQGQKRVVCGDAIYTYGESDFLLAAIDLPTVTQVTHATRTRPYLSMTLRLDMQAARQLIADFDLPSPPSSSSGLGMSTGATTAALLDSLARLLKLLGTPRDIPVLAGLVQREILYWLLMGDQGQRLRRIALAGSQGHQIAKAVAWLKSNYMRPLRTEDLAEQARMGVSTLHHHFRAITGMSPLQYQKQLRLHEARRRMLTDGLDAGSASVEVGYESQSQFTKEYRRVFGEPPMRDIRSLRSMGRPAQA